ncbi:MAG: roadblock/LC7 domain-containing protein [Anaerolineae bacterium]|nr:roadblock/LC7 domain-containing protein [Anaerolineae bacterium]
MPADEKVLQQELIRIAQHLPTTYFMAVVTVDGLIVAYAQIQPWNSGGTFQVDDEDRISAMSAADLAMGERRARELGAGDYRFNIVRGSEGSVFNILMGDDYLLTFGIRQVQSMDATLKTLQQHWGELLHLLEVPEQKR